MHSPRSPRAWFAAALALLGAAPLAAQQYVDQRLWQFDDPFNDTIQWFAHGDVDGDGADDLLVRAGYADTLLRGGPGKLGYKQTIDAIDSADASFGDLDGDGRADLVTQKFVNLGWYGGQANATFGAFHNVQSEAQNEVFWSNLVADIDGDGKLDITSSGSTDAFGSMGAVRWFRGNGAGGFTLTQSIPTAPYIIRIEAGDFDADGFVDIAGANPFGSATYVLTASGAGLAAPVDLGAAASRMAVGDFDGDGYPDLCTVASPTQLRTWYGSALGLANPQPLALPGGLAPPQVLLSAELDGDGRSDVLTHPWMQGPTPLLRSLGSAAGLQPLTSIGVGSFGALDVLEYDGHAGVDLVYGLPSGKWPVLRPGDGQGGFLEPLVLADGGACGDANGACVGDVDGDGATDLAFESGTWLRGNGDGTFAAASALGASAGDLVDLDGDGRLDAVSLALGCGGSEQLSYALGGPSGFGPTLLPPQPAAGLLIDYALADLDGDGDLDFATAGPLGCYTHLNTGGANFAPHVTTALGGPCSNIGAGDLNGDGRADLARTQRLGEPWGPFSAFLGWGLSDGAGQVTNLQSKSISTDASTELVIDDFNGDGRNDVGWLQTFPALWVAYGDAVGNLGAPQVIGGSTEGGAKGSLAFADIDGDGVRDVLVSGASDPTINVLRRSGSAYSLWTQLVATAGAGRLLPADFDGDGQIDIAWASGTSVQIALNLRDDPAGTAPFGTGSPGCVGRASIGAVQVPKLGNASFRVLAHQLPPLAPGWFALGTASSPAGTDPFALGALLHVDPLASAFVALYAAPADGSGQADRAFPVPNTPALAGAALYAQALHLGGGALGHDCVNAYLSLVSSRGLALSVQP